MAKKNIIGERVQKLRKLHQYTCEDLGKYCGCKMTTVLIRLNRTNHVLWQKINN